MKTSRFLFAGGILFWIIALFAALNHAQDLTCYLFIILGQIVFITGMHANDIGD